jgi:hypothetical protein
MSFHQDDSKSPAAFSGDSDVFDLPDAFMQSPTTTERVVDTQSGFLVVVKRQNERISISVKRRLGTPPSSSVLLTPDESLKLSKILATSLTAEEFKRDRIPRTDMRRRLLARTDEPADYSETGDYGDIAADAYHLSDGEEREPNWASLSQEALAGAAAARARRSDRKFSLSTIKLRMILVSAAVVLALAAAGISAGFLLSSIFNPASDPETVIIPNPLTPSKIDSFARVYVSDLLDFNPETYKISQIQAMSHMSQELLEHYWKETGFPLSTPQLKALPQQSTVMITEIQQKSLDVETAQVDIFAQLVQAKSKETAPIHLKLKLGITADGTIRVIEQRDITAAPNRN